MESHDSNYEHLKRYWVHGEGAAKIAWGAPGDYYRCVANLGKYVPPGQVHGQCQNLHMDATGMTTAEHAKKMGGDHHEPKSAGGEVARQMKAKGGKF